MCMFDDMAALMKAAQIRSVYAGSVGAEREGMGKGRRSSRCRIHELATNNSVGVVSWLSARGDGASWTSVGLLVSIAQVHSSSCPSTASSTPSFDPSQQLFPTIISTLSSFSRIKCILYRDFPLLSQTDRCK
jgi:hypothetical protein